MKRVLILDHDGVICLEHNWGSRIKTKKQFDEFDKKAVRVLNEIIQETNCVIVISSDWGTKGTIQEITDHYIEQGIIKSPSSFTPSSIIFSSSIYERQRASEILAWVKYNLTDADRWVAVDDLDLSPYITDNFVRTKYEREGIKQTGIKNKIIKVLNQ